MKIISGMVQGDASWHQLRSQRFTASEAAAACGDHKYMTRNDLLKQKATGLVPEVGAHQQRIFDAGHKFEEMARPIAEEIMGEELYPCTCEDDSGTYLASMDGLDIIGLNGWEHKAANEKLRTATAETLEEHYKWQMDHQMMVTGAERILFMSSNGTKEDCNWFWYERDEKRIERLIAAWEQFAKDLAVYEAPEPEQAKPEGKAPDDLPALSVQVTGMVTASNLKEFESHARSVLAGINTDLQTDEDFVSAEKTVKFCKEVEKRLDGTKENVLGQMQTVDEVVKTIDRIKEETRQIRLKLDKAVKDQKEQRKLEILRDAKQDYDTFVRGLDVGQYMPVNMPDFAGAMKGKRTISSLKGACDDLMAQAKIEANELAAVIRGNLKQLDEQAGDYRFLFNDLNMIVTKPADDFAATVYTRISDYQRQQAEQEAKAKREAEAAAQREAASKKQPANPLTDGPEISYREPDPAERPAAQVTAEETVTISRKEYEQLVHNSKLYLALAAAGVDNWEGYDMAMEIMQEAA